MKFFCQRVKFQSNKVTAVICSYCSNICHLFVPVVDAELIHKNSTSHKVTVTPMIAIKHRKMLHTGIFLQLCVTACSSTSMILQKQKTAFHVMFNAYKISPLHSTNVLSLTCTNTEPSEFNPHPATPYLYGTF